MRKLLSLFCALMLLCASLPAWADGEFSAYVKKGAATIYSDAKLKTPAGSLRKNTVVTVLAYRDGVAKIQYKSRTGFARVSDLGRVSDIARRATLVRESTVYSRASTKSSYVSVAAGTEVYVLKVTGACAMIERGGKVGYVHKNNLSLYAAEEPAKEEKPEIVYVEYEAKVTSSSLRVYASASTKAKSLGTLKKGALVTVVATCGDWARVKKGERVGYCALGSLEKYVDPYAYLKDGRYSNEKTIYTFLTKEMKLSPAAACGALANIKFESGYRTGALGDGGRSFGICQWFYLRFTRLKNFCQNRNYDYETIEGQLWFLKYELETYYPMVLRYLRGVENTAKGAYDAGWYWCYHFEGPANRERLSVTRGNYARDTVWARYGG